MIMYWSAHELWTSQVRGRLAEGEEEWEGGGAEQSPQNKDEKMDR
jgi:hypothetical protein